MSEQQQETRYEVEVSVKHQEAFDVETGSKDGAERLAKSMVAEDIEAGWIDPSSFEWDIQVEEAPRHE